jgi:hypothetical protein
MDLHCPEAAALYASLCFVRLLLLKYPRGLTTGLIPHLHFVLDKKSAADDDLKWEFKDSTSVFNYLKSDYDLLQGIQHEICNLPIASKSAGSRDTKTVTSHVASCLWKHLPIVSPMMCAPKLTTVTPVQSDASQTGFLAPKLHFSIMAN